MHEFRKPTPTPHPQPPTCNSTAEGIGVDYEQYSWVLVSLAFLGFIAYTNFCITYGTHIPCTKHAVSGFM